MNLSLGTFKEWKSTRPLATFLAWNGIQYCCYFCDRPWRRLSSLNHHLASNKHKDSHCTICGKDCDDLIGLVNHLESDSCRWYMFDARKYKAEV